MLKDSFELALCLDCIDQVSEQVLLKALLSGHCLMFQIFWHHRLEYSELRRKLA